MHKPDPKRIAGKFELLKNDFLEEKEEKSCPILFINGFMTPNMAVVPLLKSYQKKTKNFHVVENNLQNNLPVPEMAFKLHQKIESLGVSEIDIVGVSYGGLIALYYATNLATQKVKIRKLVTICSPIRGIDIKAIHLVSHLPLKICETVKDMLHDGVVVDRILTNADRLDNVDRLHIAHMNDFLAPPTKAVLPGGEAYISRFPYPTPVAHQFACVHPSIHKKVMSFLNS